VDAIQPGVFINLASFSEAQRRRFMYGVEALHIRISAEESADSEPTTAWNLDGTNVALARLRTEGWHAQATAIETACKQGGTITREEVYGVAGYEPERSLRGFTRPVRRVCQELRDQGLVPADAADLLSAVYDEGISGYQRAGAFCVPDEIVALLG
jgi:hypothetical protein